MSVERKYERDIDLLLAEEFSVSPGFASWFQAQARFADLKADVVDVSYRAAMLRVSPIW